MIVIQALCIYAQIRIPVRMNIIESKNGETQKNIRASNAVDDVDWAGLRAAAVAIGIRPAARQAARDLPPDEQE